MNNALRFVFTFISFFLIAIALAISLIILSPFLAIGSVLILVFWVIVGILFLIGGFFVFLWYISKKEEVIKNKNFSIKQGKEIK
jgi:hypothetical protein